MNNSQWHVLAVINKDYSSLLMSCTRVTGSLSCLLKEAEDWDMYSNSNFWYHLWYHNDEVGDYTGLTFNSYTDLLQYLRKEVA